MESKRKFLIDQNFKEAKKTNFRGSFKKNLCCQLLPDLLSLNGTEVI